MKKLIYGLLIMLTGASNSVSQITYNAYVASVMNNVIADSVYKFERQLSGDTASLIGGAPYTIATRHYAREGNTKAAQYILERFQSFGLIASYQQINSTIFNVLGKKIGYKYPNQYLIVCAHYDNMPSGTLAPGADDNATGTAAVIEAARVLSSISLPYTVVFAAWDEEERGLYGSKAYADTARRKNDSIIAVLNFDMIGYDGNNDGALDINTNTASTPLANDFYQVVIAYQPTLVPQITTSLNGGSDHQSFQQKNYRAILSIEDNSDFTPYYHTVNDNYSTLNKPYFLKMVKAGVAASVTLAGNFKNMFHLNLLAGIEGFWNGTVQKQDTMRVVLRAASSPYQIIETKFVYLNQNGNAVADFETASNGSYFIQLLHRNALETWTAAPVSFSKGSTTSYSFTTSSSQAYGNNMVLKSGRYCLYSGDVDKDGAIDVDDLTLADNSVGTFQTGYVSTDVNGDSFVDLTDLSLIDNNAYSFVQVARP